MQKRSAVLASLAVATTLVVGAAPAASAAALSVATLPVSGVSADGVTAHCAVETGRRTQVFLKWGLVGKSQAKSPRTWVYSPVPDIPIQLSGLAADTAYSVQCRAYNSTDHTVYGEKIVVTTAGSRPSDPPPSDPPPSDPPPSDPPPSDPPPSDPPPSDPPPSGSTRIVAVGDLCDPNPVKSCNATGTVAAGLNPKLYALIGDYQYEDGTPAEFANGYATSTWDPLNAASYPAIGNHEVQSGNDNGYCGYFTHAHCSGTARWYAYDIDTNWRAVVLDSNRPSNSAQLSWLRSELAALGDRNLLVYWHHPRWENGGLKGKNRKAVNALMQPCYDAGADIVLWGHDHLYERFAKMSTTGPDAQKGMRAFTVGTGGTGLRGRVTADLKPGTEKVVRQLGVLELNLGPAGYSWAFHATNGSVLDSGSDSVTR